MADAKIRVNLSHHAPLLLAKGPEGSAFHYPGWGTLANHAGIRVDIQSDTDTTQQTTFKFNRLHDLLGPVQLIFDVAPLSAAPAPGPGDTLRFVDWLGLAFIDHIEVSFSGHSLIHRMDRDTEFLKIMKRKGESRFDAAAELAAGNLSPAERDARALTTQTIILDLQLPWTHDPSLYIPINALSDEIRISIHWRPLARVVQTNLAFATVSGGTRDNVRLRCTYYEVEPDEKQALVAMTQTGAGKVVKTDDVEIESSKIIPAGTAGNVDIAFDIRNLKQATYDFTFVVRPVNSINGNNDPVTGVGPLERFRRVARWRIRGSNTDIVPTIEDRYQRFYMNPEVYPGNPGALLYGDTFSLMPSDVLNATGHLEIGNLTAPQLIIQLDPAEVPVGEDWQVDMFAFVHQHHQIYNGDITAVFR